MAGAVDTSVVFGIRDLLLPPQLQDRITRWRELRDHYTSDQRTDEMLAIETELLNIEDDLAALLEHLGETDDERGGLRLASVILVRALSGFRP
ncbi:MAG TPA: hypothetical protein VIC35_11680 [Acidimicrobiia bacterium]